MLHEPGVDWLLKPAMAK